MQCLSYYFIYILLAWHVSRTMRTQMSLHSDNTNYSGIFAASVPACNCRLWLLMHPILGTLFTWRWWDRPFSPLLFSKRNWKGKIPDTPVLFSNLHLNHVLAIFSFLEWACYTLVCYEIYYLCSLTFNSFLHYSVFNLHRKFLYVACNLRETLIVVWAF